jgi:hypothetical protein
MTTEFKRVKHAQRNTEVNALANVKTRENRLTMDTKRWVSKLEDGTAVREGGYSVRYMERFTTVAAAITAFGSSNVIGILASSLTLTANATVAATTFLDIVRGGSINLNGFTLTISGPFRAGRYQVFSGSGTVVLTAGCCDFVCPEWWGASTASSDNTAAFQAALNAASSASAPGRPGLVRTATGTWVCTGTITMPTRLVIWEGMGADSTTMRHNPATFSDFVTGDTGGEGFVGFRDIRFCGRAYQTGNTRYLISYANFNENCFIENVEMRDSVGFLKITNGYLSTIRKLRCQSATPNAVAGGIANSDWTQVWDDGHAPIHLRGMNGSTIDGLHLYRIGSEVVNGVTPASPILIEATQSLTIRGIQTEGGTTYTDGATYTIRQKSIIIANSVAGLLIDGWYNEANYTTEHLFHAKAATQAHLRGVNAYNIDCTSDLFRSESLWNLFVSTSSMYRVRSPYLYKVTQAGFSVQGVIHFEDVLVAPGDIFTDAVLSSDAENVIDTYGTGAANLLGVADQDELTYSTKRLFTPRRNTGLVVTAGSDPTYTGVGVATGHYIQITGGTFFNEAGKPITVKRSTGNSLASNLAVFRLRPATASKYYRLYIGEAGSPYLVESAGAFADDRGNWIAQFRTDASIHIVKYSDGVTAGLDADPYNPRLGVNGFYIPNQTNIEVTGTAVPTTGQWLVGDVFRLTNPTADAIGQASSIGWVCTAAGTPGTWTKITDSALFAALLGRVGGQTLRGGTGSGDNLTLLSTSHATKGKVLLGTLSGYDEVNDRLGLGTQSPSAKQHVLGSVLGELEIARLENTDNTAASLLQAIYTHYRLRGNGAATARTAGYIRVGKEGNFDSAANMDATIDLMPSIDETPTNTFSASATYGARCYRRLNKAKGADVGSANDMTLGDAGNLFQITGTTQINRITTTGWLQGAEITLKFSGSVTVTHQGAATSGALARLNLAGAVNFSATANDVLKLVYDGTDWFEVSRTVI